MEKRKIFLNHLQQQSHTYLEIISWYRTGIGWFFDNGKNTIHTVPFLLTCAAALECSLNDNIIQYFTSQYGEHGELQISGFLSMNFKGKLLNVVPLLTSNKYMINVNHKIYQKLSELIKIRNRLVHNKSNYEMYESHIEETEEGTPFITIPDDLDKKLSKKIDPTLGIKVGDIGEFHDCLEKFHELFIDVYDNDDFKGNELIINMSKGTEVTFVIKE